MISYYIHKNNDYYCANCLMKAPTVEPFCFFCGYEMSNFEEIAIQLYKDLTNSQISSIIDTEREKEVNLDEEH